MMSTSRRLGAMCGRLGASHFDTPTLTLRFRLKPTMIAAHYLSTNSNKSENNPSNPAVVDEVVKITGDSDDDITFTRGEILLYKESQITNILLGLGVSFINFVYWSSQIVHYVMYKDVVVEGIALAGDPYLGAFGTFSTAFFLFFTKQYANHSAYICYESKDHKRIGFQMHTMFGKPGRKFEAPLGNARFVDNTNSITKADEQDHAARKAKKEASVFNKVIANSTVPVIVDGFKGNVLIDSDGTFYDKARLCELLSKPANAILKTQPRSKPKFSGKKSTK